MSILRKVEFEQADFMWQYQLRYERDVVAQVGGEEPLTGSLVTGPVGAVLVPGFNPSMNTREVESLPLDEETFAARFLDPTA